MILLPALAVVQIIQMRIENEAKNATALKARQEMNFQCQQIVDTCQLFTSNDENRFSCDKIIEYGEFCQ